MPCADWQVRWETTHSGFQRYEVFTAPDGREWLKAKDAKVAMVYLLPRTPGLQPRALRPRKTSDKQAAAVTESKPARTSVRRK